MSKRVLRQGHPLDSTAPVLRLPVPLVVALSMTTVAVSQRKTLAKRRRDRNYLTVRTAIQHGSPSAIKRWPMLATKTVPRRRPALQHTSGHTVPLNERVDQPREQAVRPLLPRQA